MGCTKRKKGMHLEEERGVVKERKGCTKRKKGVY